MVNVDNFEADSMTIDDHVGRPVLVSLRDTNFMMKNVTLEANFRHDKFVVSQLMLFEAVYQPQRLNYKERIVQRSIRGIEYDNVYSSNFRETTMRCPPGYRILYDDSIEFGPTGEWRQADKRLVCRPCSKGYYLYIGGSVVLGMGKQPSLKNTECKPCPYGANCMGGSNVIAKDGFWGKPNLVQDLIFYPCIEGHCCSGKTCKNSTYFSPCMKKRSGTICTQCENGWYLDFGRQDCTFNSCTKWSFVIIYGAIFAFS